MANKEQQNPHYSEFPGISYQYEPSVSDEIKYNGVKFYEFPLILFGSVLGAAFGFVKTYFSSLDFYGSLLQNSDIKDKSSERVFKIPESFSIFTAWLVGLSTGSTAGAYFTYDFVLKKEKKSIFVPLISSFVGSAAGIVGWTAIRPQRFSKTTQNIIAYSLLMLPPTLCSISLLF
ncbi:MAG: hypothetical protein NZ927_00280 [Candidatus Calescibacterium sp.]|nr:hypothetical protein [Candidatus Calescibacterium sp.]